MTGVALTLVGITLCLAAGGVACLLLIWRGADRREAILFAEGDDGDATLQEARTHDSHSPDWIRINLRDGRMVVATRESDPARYRVGIVPLAHETSELAEPDVCWQLRRESIGTGFAEPVAIHDAQGMRIGALVPDENGRRLGLPVQWSAHLGAHRWTVAGNCVLAGDRRVVQSFAGPFPRLGLVLWGADVGTTDREQLSVLLLAMRWSERLLRARALRREE